MRFYFFNEIFESQFRLSLVGNASIALTVMFTVYCIYTFLILLYAKILWDRTEQLLIKQEKDLASEYLNYEERIIRLQNIRTQFDTMAKFLSNRVIPQSTQLNTKVRSTKKSKKYIDSEFKALVDKVDTDVKTMDESLRFINDLIHQEKKTSDGPKK
jgi:hypothetical protein